MLGDRPRAWRALAKGARDTSRRSVIIPRCRRMARVDFVEIFCGWNMREGDLVKVSVIALIWWGLEPSKTSGAVR